jgi:MFS family permease
MAPVGAANLMDFFLANPDNQRSQYSDRVAPPPPAGAPDRLETGAVSRHFDGRADAPLAARPAPLLARAEPLLSSESSVTSHPSAGGEQRWGVFSNRAFTVILIATSISNICIGMFDTATSWLMTSLDPNPMMVSTVQVATSLPLFLLTFPSGALADLVDARRLLIGAQLAVSVIAIVFAVIVSLDLATPSILLTAAFLLGAAGALAAPAWLLITPMLVPREELDNAIAINNSSYNVSRAIGPALGGFAIAAVSIDTPFWFYFAGSLVLLGAVVWWRGPRRIRETLPAERLSSSLRTGLRYARYNRALDATLVRAVAFFLFASAYWALLPLVARTQLHNGPVLYGVLLGMIGFGSILGSFGIAWLKERLGPDRLAGLGTLGTVAALLMYGAAREPYLAMGASLVAGACWIIVMTTMFVSAQVALPEWVRGRGLAIFLTVFFGSMTVGSAIWGKVASLEGLPTTFYLAAAGLSMGLIATWRWKLQTAAALDLSPAMHWRSPFFVRRVEDDEGPILVTIEYKVDPQDKAAFLAAMQEIGRERRRDGSFAWHVFEDVAVVDRVVETFLIQSLLELRHLRARVTQADRAIEQRAHKFLLQPPKVTFLVSPKRSREKRRRLAASTPAPAVESAGAR